MRVTVSSVAIACFLVSTLGCAGDEVVDETTDGLGTFNDEYQKDLMEAPPSTGKDDSTSGIAGPRAITDGAVTEVWAVTNQWEDTDTPAARKAGMAWAEDSGLDWNEKYTAWVRSMKKIEATSYGDTFEFTTPYGVTLTSPELECAETSVFLRVAFASWYGLPFYITAYSEGSNMHFGHFGVWRNEAPDSRFSNYRTRYADHSDMTPEAALANWPTDSKLAGRKLSKNGDDLNEWMGENAHAGAYFDKIFLNKRVGHFLVIILTYTGSIHLASTQNTFNLKARAVREGDTLLERWQKKGIGHTLVVKRVDPIEGTEYLEADLISGSMPRRQAKWESPASSKYSFTMANTGGIGESNGGIPYAKLGGGIKRWRVAKVINGRWRNVVAGNDQEHFIPSYDLDAISERPAIFEEILNEETPELKAQTLLGRIAEKRLHLEQYPASCSAREVREATFDELYALTETEWQWTKAQTDQQYRTLADYVFPEMVYAESRTCCWNSSTSEMYQAIMDYNEKHVLDEETNTCNQPVPFMMVDGGYKVFEDHAAAVGAAWVQWSADESCPQEHTVTTDTQAEHRWVPYCEAFPPAAPPENENPE